MVNRSEQAKEPIVWTGDLSDDCTAEWAGLMLRAEWMEDDIWWWAVYDMQKNELIVDASYNREETYKGGPEARLEAEGVARNYLNTLSI